MTDEPKSISLKFTGERMIPEGADALTFWEHIYRYRFALRFVKDKRVLDIACGEGYGSAALRQSKAKMVIGIDISEQTCLHARRRYGLDVLQADAQTIPLADRSVDVVISFETIEHLPDPHKFLDECVRVLSPHGMLIISTPVRDTYRSTGRSSAFHCSELSEAELVAMLRARFSKIRLYSQQPTQGQWFSLRPLALITSPWLRLRGMYRLRSMLLNSKERRQLMQVTESQRQSATKLILNRDSLGLGLINPFAVVRQLPWSNERPVYLIAVARL